MESAFPDDDRKRHSTALMVVLDIFPPIMRDMICNPFPPNTVLELIENDSKFDTNLHSMEKKMISDIRSKGYNSLDISLFYKIIRYFKLLRPPNQGWGKKPESGDINKGDDVERMKNLRNDVIHRPAGGLSELEINDFFRQSIEIAKRMDDRIGRPRNGFESKVEEIRSYTITHENYIKLLEKCVEHQARLQEIAGAPSFDLFYGNDIKIKIDAQIDHTGSGGRTLACSLYLKDPDFDVNAAIQMLDVIQEYLRKGNYKVALEDAASGSLILHVTIDDTCFMTKEILHKTVQTFLHAFFIGAAIPFKLEHIYTVVLGESEYLVLDNEKKNDLDYLRENTSPYLKLNVNVNDSAFQNEFTLYREVNSFVAGMYNAVDRQNVPSNGSSREVLMMVDNERVINYSNTFEAIRESQFRMAQVPVVSERESNYFKISTLLLRISPRAVRMKFDDVFHPEHLTDTLSSNLSKLTDLKDKRCINQTQWNSMFPRTDDPTSQSFDTTLMVCLLRNLAGNQIANKLPPPTDFSVGADLSRIKTYRKVIANSKDRTFKNEKFAAIWNDTEAAVIRLSSGKLKKDCCTLKTKTYDVADIKKNRSLIQDGKRLVRIEEINEVADRAEKIDFKQKPDKIQGICGTLSDQMAETTNAKVLRLDLENQRFKKKIEELRESSLIENTSLNLELEKENERLAKKIEKLQGSANDSSQQCIDLEQNLHVAARERDNLAQTLETLKDSYERQVRELEAENDNLQQTVHVIRQRNEQTNDTRLKELEKENKQLHETVTAKNQVTSKLEHENRQIQKSFSKIKLNSDHINELETENSQFEKENSELRKSIATLQLTCDKSEVLEQENSDLEVENRKLQKSVQTLKSALQKKENLEQENINLTVENKKLERSLHSMKSASSRIAELESEKDSMNREIQQLRKSLENQRNQRTKQEQMELDLLDLDNENQRIQKSLEVTTKRLNQLEKDNTDLEVENEKLQKTMEEMKMSSKRLHNVEKKRSELENEVSKLQTSKAVLEKENKRLKQSVQLKDTTVDELTTKCSIMEREHRSVKRTLETSKETSSKLHEFERENREILQQSNINKKTKATLREELVNEKIKSQQLNNELEKLNGELERVGINKEKLVMAEHSQDDKSKEKSMMTSSAKHICTFCNDSGITKAAVTWCMECEVFFCGECEKTHRMSRMYKNHKTIASQDYHKLPKIMQEISSKCRDHKETFKLYCSVHTCPCCVQCVTDKHEKCHMKPLSDFIKDVKVSDSIRIYEQDLKDVNKNLVKAIDYLNTRISTINTQKTEALEQIRFTRRSIDDYLIKIEQQILDDLDSKHSELELNMASFVKQMEQRLIKIEQIQSEYTEMIQYATNLQTYIALGEIAKTTSETATYIAGLKESGDLFSEKNLELNISPCIQSIEKDVKSFGDITINTNPSTLLIKTGRKNQALCISRMDLIKTSSLERLTIPQNMTFLNIRACLILSDGRVMILDYNKKQLLLFDNVGIFVRTVVIFEWYPFDACLVEQNTVAVILESDQTALVDVEENTIVKIIELSHYSYGIASDGKNLIISSDGRNIGMSCESHRITKVNLHDMPQFILDGVKKLNCIALFQGRIYGTNSSENTVCCYKSTGEPVWTFQHQHIAKPGGLSLDNNGFVYLASQKNDSIVVVSPDGKTCKTILSEADGIKSPWAIDINRETRRMVVSSYASDDKSNICYEYDTAFVYKI